MDCGNLAFQNIVVRYTVHLPDAGRDMIRRLLGGRFGVLEVPAEPDAVAVPALGRRPLVAQRRTHTELPDFIAFRLKLGSFTVSLAVPFSVLSECCTAC